MADVVEALAHLIAHRGVATRWSLGLEAARIPATSSAAMAKLAASIHTALAAPIAAPARRRSRARSPTRRTRATSAHRSHWQLRRTDKAGNAPNTAASLKTKHVAESNADDVDLSDREHTRGERDRDLAISAPSARLPPTISRRRSKRSATGPRRARTGGTGQPGDRRSARSARPSRCAGRRGSAATALDRAPRRADALGRRPAHERGRPPERGAALTAAIND